ncbi:MAG: TlpA disulfide reductase family protein [Phycisphaerales bacterium]
MLNSRKLRGRAGALAAPTLLLAAVFSTPAALADDVKPAAPAAARPADPPKESGWGERLKKLDEYSRKLNESGKPFDRAEFEAFAKGLLADVDVSKLSMGDLESGWMLISAVPDASTKAKDRLAELAKATNVDGAQAAIFLAQTSRSTAPEQWSKLAQAAWDHPGFEAALDARGWRARLQSMGMLSAIDSASRGTYVDRVIGWSDRFTPDSSPADMKYVAAYMKGVRDLGDSVSATTFDATRMKLLETVKKARDKAAAAGKDEDVKQLDKLARRLDSPAMKGTLIGNAAPELAFRKILDTNGTPTWKSLEDLKGKVVVLDFWATWCGPCVASFPNVRELRKHYSADDVVIIGVTSPQEAIYWKGKPKQDFKGDAAGEMNTMIDYMKEMDMTWPVAFTEQEVFNPDYDVNGIPHLAIIDTAGKLRWNDLHPAMPLKEKTDKIDSLLKEAGKTPPPPPAEDAAGK